MKSTYLVIFILLVPALVISQEIDLALEQEAITRVALDYMEGAHEGNANRIAKAVHPELTKVTLSKLPKTGITVLRKAGASRLIELVRANVAALEEGKRDIQVSVYSVKEGLASVRVISSMFYDYLQLAKIDGKWKLINVLWVNNEKPADDVQKSEADITEEKEAITKTALDYIEGSFSGDAARMERALHPELTKVVPVTLPQTGEMMLDKMGAEMLIEGTRAQLGLLPEEKRNIKVTVFDVKQGIANVEILSAMYFDYLQMAKINGNWKIVNVLWTMNPEAPKQTS